MKTKRETWETAPRMFCSLAPSPPPAAQCPLCLVWLTHTQTHTQRCVPFGFAIIHIKEVLHWLLRVSQGEGRNSECFGAPHSSNVSEPRGSLTLPSWENCVWCIFNESHTWSIPSDLPANLRFTRRKKRCSLHTDVLKVDMMIWQEDWYENIKPIKTGWEGPRWNR